MAVKLGLKYSGRMRVEVFENRVLGKIFEPDKGEVTGDKRKFHKEELHVLCPSPR
jgi:hypothetical protein